MVFFGAFPEVMMLVVGVFKGLLLQKTASPEVPANARGGRLVRLSVCPPARPALLSPGGWTAVAPGAGISHPTPGAALLVRALRTG